MSVAGWDPDAARVARLARELDELELDALLVDSLVSVRYLTGFTGSNGLVLAVAEASRAKLGSHRFLSDFRYATQSAAQVPDAFSREIVAEESARGARRLARGRERPARLRRRERHRQTPRRSSRSCLGRDGSSSPAPAPSSGCAPSRTRARSHASGRPASSRTRRCAGILEEGLVGRSEQEVALELELRMRRLGAQAPSFPSIVAAGAHGALPHGQPRAEPIPRDVLVTIDWGALHEGYCSDCTRTFATGEGISARAREIYELVLRAQEQGLEAVLPGSSGREVDAVARAVIEAAGEGEHFGHGLGHGVGLEIHEGPRLSRTAGEEPLRAGNVVTVEPGVYLPGLLGVRIEDLVVVRDGAQEVLTSLPKELTVVS